VCNNNPWNSAWPFLKDGRCSELSFRNKIFEMGLQNGGRYRQIVKYFFWNSDGYGLLCGEYHYFLVSLLGQATGQTKT